MLLVAVALLIEREPWIRLLAGAASPALQHPAFQASRLFNEFALLHPNDL